MCQAQNQVRLKGLDLGTNGRAEEFEVAQAGGEGGGGHGGGREKIIIVIIIIRIIIITIWINKNPARPIGLIPKKLK